jgi:hypothetical protein
MDNKCIDCGAEIEKKRLGRPPKRCPQCINPARKEKEAKYEMSCHLCGKLFMAKMPDRAKYCSDCGGKSSGRKWNGLTYSRKLVVFKKFGITPQMYDELLAKQGGKCAICKLNTPGSLSNDGKNKDWSLDHDHVTGKVRGFLCNGCNRGIGFLKDSPDVVRGALEYLLLHEEKHNF